MGATGRAAAVRAGVALFAAAFLVRLPICAWGLPYQYSADECLYLDRSLILIQNGFDPAIYRIPGHLTVYLHFLASGTYYAIGRLAGAFGSPQEFAVAHFVDPTGLTFACRALEAAVSAAGVVLLFHVARRWFSAAAALLAAAAYALHPLVLEQAGVVRTDSAMLLETVALLAVAQRLLEDRKASLYVAAGALLGVAFATKYLACFAAFPLAVAHLAGGGRLRDSGRKLALAAAAFVGGVLISAPYLILHAAQTVEGMRSILASVAGGDPYMRAPHPLGGWWYVPVDVWETFGPAGIAAVLAAGVGLAVRREDRARLAVLVSLPLALYLFALGPNPIHVPRFLLPAVPGLALLLAWAFDRIPAERRGWRIAAGALILATPLLRAYETVREKTGPDTRTEARAWIAEHVPAGAALLVFNWSDCPQLETRGSFLRRRYAASSIHRVSTGFAETKKSAARLLDALPPAAWEIMYLQFWEYPRPLAEEVAARGVGWVVLPFRADALSRAWCEPAQIRLLEELGPRLRLVREVLPDAGERFGPTICVYRLEE